MTSDINYNQEEESAARNLQIRNIHTQRNLIIKGTLCGGMIALRLLEYSVWIKIAEGLRCLSTGRHGRSNLPDVPHMALESLEKFPHRPYVDFSENNQKLLAQELVDNSFAAACEMVKHIYCFNRESPDEETSTCNSQYLFHNYNVITIFKLILSYNIQIQNKSPHSFLTIFGSKNNTFEKISVYNALHGVVYDAVYTVVYRVVYGVVYSVVYGMVYDVVYNVMYSVVYVTHNVVYKVVYHVLYSAMDIVFEVVYVIYGIVSVVYNLVSVVYGIVYGV
ncbi:hypothetical protein ABVT39_017281 [Epinephelus coioides]